MPPQQPPPPLLPLGQPVFNVLLALGDELLHGYAIMQRFAELARGADQLLPGTLYSTLARMAELGLIEERPAPPGEASGGPPRRHYQVTARGRAAAKAEAERMQRLVNLAKRRSILPKAAG